MLKDVSARHANWKSVGRFLVRNLFDCRDNPSVLQALADADRAGDSGSVILQVNRLINAWTKQQSIMATSSDEAKRIVRQSRWEFRRSPKIRVDPCRFG